MSRNHLWLFALAALCVGLYFLTPATEPAAPAALPVAQSSERAPTLQHAPGLVEASTGHARAIQDDEEGPSRSAPIRGRVLDSNRAPIAGASVRYGGAAHVVSDDQGRFGFSASSQQALLQVSATGMADAALAGIAPGSEVVVVLEPQTSLRGWLLCERTGQPVPDGWVEVKQASVTRTARAGKDGSFVLDGLTSGRALLLAGGSQHDLVRRASFQLGEHDGPLTLRLPTAGRVHGKVLSHETGKAMADVAVVYSSGNGASGQSRTVHTDGEGRFDFGVAATADAKLQIAASEHAALTRRLTPADRDRELELQLSAPSAPSRIRVVEDGRPKRGVTVVCKQDLREQRVTTDREGLAHVRIDTSKPVELSCRTAYASATTTWIATNSEEATLELQTYASVEVIAEAARFAGLPVLVETRGGIHGGTIDGSGLCRLDDLCIGPVTVLLGPQRLVIGKALLRPGQHKPFAVTDRDLTNVTLHVTDDAGTPLAGARWMLRQPGSARVGTAQGFTGADGHAKVVAVGYGDLHVSRPGYLPTKIDIDSARDQGGFRTVTLKAERRIAGRVLDAQSQAPVEQFTVICLPGRTEQTFWSPTGEFAFAAPDVTAVQIRATGWETSPMLACDGTDIRAELQAAGGVHGRVLGPSGAGLAKVRVHLETTGIESPPPVVTTADGSFAFVGVAPGGYRLSARSGTNMLTSTDLVVRDSRQRQHKVLRVAELPSVHVLAYDRNIGPAGATAISVECTTAGGVQRRTASADVDGYAHIRDLLPGLYTIKARTRGRRAVSLVNLSLDDEEPLVELTLR